MLIKRGNSISYLRMFSFVLVILMTFLIFFVPSIFFGKFGFNSLFGGSKLFLSPSSNNATENSTSSGGNFTEENIFTNYLI